ncbi:MAG: MFS transporter [Cytophagales bacterium]|nr:MFS transporter [Cytophagales bacterium]
MRVYNLNFWLLCFSSFLFFGSFNMIIPELPDFMRSIGGEKYIGFHIALFTLTAGLSRPFSGKLTDRWGRVPVMVIGAVVTGVVSLFYPFALNIYGFMFLRLLHGFSTGFKPTGTAAYVADVVPANRRGEAMGIVSFFGMVGMGIGNFISSKIVMAYSIDALFYTSSAVAVFSIIILLRLKETLEEREKFSADLLKINASDLYEPTAIRPSIVMMLNTFCFGVVISLFPDFGMYHGIAPEDKGLYFVFFTGASLVARIVGGKLSDMFGRVPVVRISTLVVAAGSLTTGFSYDATSFFMGGLIFGTGYGLTSPALFAWVADLAPKKSIGKGMSTLFISLEVGIGMGALMAGIFYQSDPTRFPWIFGGAAFLSFLAFLYLVIYKPKPTNLRPQ